MPFQQIQFYITTNQMNKQVYGDQASTYNVINTSDPLNVMPKLVHEAL